MTVDRSTLLLFDAVCLISSSASPTGGSGYLLELAHRRFFLVAVSEPVLREAERNLTAKFSPMALARFHWYLEEIEFVLAGVVETDDFGRYEAVTGAKDAHVLAAAIDVDANAIITLDRPLIAGIRSMFPALQAMTPGDFIEGPMKSHPEYLKFRGA